MSYSAWKDSVQRRFYEHGMYVSRSMNQPSAAARPSQGGLDSSGLHWAGSGSVQPSTHDDSQGDVMDSSFRSGGPSPSGEHEYLPHCFLTQILSNTLQHRSVSNQPTPLSSPRRDRDHSNMFDSKVAGQARKPDSFSSILQSKSKVLLVHETGIAQKALRANQELQDLLQYVRHVNRMNSRKAPSEAVAANTTDAIDDGYSADDWESDSEGQQVERTLVL
jgi:hypothetical protein